MGDIILEERRFETRELALRSWEIAVVIVACLRSISFFMKEESW